MADTPPNPEATAAAARKRRLDLRWNKVTSSKGDVYSRKVVDGTAGLPPKSDSTAGEAQGRPSPGLQHWGSGGFLEGTSGAPFLVASTLSRSSSEDAARDLFFRSNSSSSANSAAPAPSAIQEFSAVALRAKFRRPQFRRLKEDSKGEAGKQPSADTDKPEGGSGADEDATSDDISSETSSSGTSTSSDEDAMDAVVTAAASLLREEMTLSSMSDSGALGSGSFAPPAAGALSLTAGGDSAPQGPGSTTGAVVNTVPSQCVSPPWMPGLPGDHCPSNGVLSVCGRRREMEDAVSMVPAFATVPCCSSVGCVGVHQALTGGSATAPGNASEGKCQFHLFAVYDGHGGSQAANFCALHMAQTLEEELSLSVKASEAAKAAGGEAWSPPVSLSAMEGQWKQAFITSFARVDAEVSGHCYERRSRCNMSGDCGHQPLADETVGTTAVVSVLTQRHIIVGNCGDSRAVLSRGGQAFALSKDHKPDREDEMKRIEAAGGRVVFWNGYVLLCLSLCPSALLFITCPLVLSCPPACDRAALDAKDVCSHATCMRELVQALLPSMLALLRVRSATCDPGISFVAVTASWEC